MKLKQQVKNVFQKKSYMYAASTDERQGQEVSSPPTSSSSPSSIHVSFPYDELDAISDRHYISTIMEQKLKESSITSSRYDGFGRPQQQDDSRSDEETFSKLTFSLLQYNKTKQRGVASSSLSTTSGTTATSTATTLALAPIAEEPSIAYQRWEHFMDSVAFPERHLTYENWEAFMDTVAFP